VKIDDRFQTWRRPSGAQHLVRAAGLFLGVFAVAASVGVFTPTSVAAQQRGELGIALGEQPELVMMEDLEGNEVSLAQYVEGRPALIEFWARWCELCEALHPQMVETYARYEGRVEFVAVAVAVAQSQRSVRRHLEDEPMGFPILWDDGGRAVRAFLAPGTSYIVVLNAEGKVTYTGSGAGQDIEAAVRTGLQASQ
jgi:thiol-disulfide isomerase/thioredoxin